MTSYLRFGTSPSRPSLASTAQPDFAAFDSDSDDDSPQHPASSHSHQLIRSRSPSPTARSGGIQLGEEVHDPLQSNAGRRPNHHQAQQQARTTLPGSYDFEPQAQHQGGSSGSSAAGRSRAPSSAGGLDGDGGGEGAAGRSTGGASYRRPMSLRERLMPGALYARLSNRAQEEDDSADQHDRLLFDESSADEASSSPSPSYPPTSQLHMHTPLPARPPQFAPPSAGAGAGGQGGRVFGGGQGNDGVFANLSAKPDGATGGDYVGGEEGDNKDEVLPAYEVAAMDTTPPYWETTVVTPGGLLGPDDICVDGLPVGNLFGFAWNLLVSMSFQFVGFLLTYLLHTTHAAKNGSRAGLGITLIQLGFYLKQRAEHPELFPEFAFDGSLNSTSPLSSSSSNPYTAPQLDPNDPANWSWWGGVTSPSPSSTTSALGSLPTQIHGALSGALSASDPDVQEAMRNGTMPSLTGQLSQEELMKMSSAANEWMAFFMVTIGSFLVIGACLSYWRAVRWARAVRAGQGPGADQENMLRSFLAH